MRIKVCILLAALLLVGCSPRLIERVVYQRDTTQVVKRDSVLIYDRDSIFIREKGDTVYQYVEKWRYRDRWRVDTFYRVRIDSVAVETPIEVQIDKPLSRWQSLKISAFWYLLAAVLVLLVWAFRKPILKLLKP